MPKKSAASRAAIELNRIRWAKQTPDPEFFKRIRMIGAIKRGEKIKGQEDKQNPPTEETK